MAGIPCTFDDPSANELTWNTSSAGFNYTKLPNGVIFAYKNVQLNMSGATAPVSAGQHPSSYFKTTSYNISDIGFTKMCMGSADLSGSYPQSLAIEVASKNSLSTLDVTMFADNNNSTNWSAKITLIGI